MTITTDSIASAAGQVGWTRDLARDLFPGHTTPFARTLLSGPAEHALRTAYAELGGRNPDTPFWQFRNGYAYLDAAAVAEADLSLYGAGWLGSTPGEAPAGLRARLQSGSIIRRCQARQAAAIGEAAGLQTRLSRWWAWVQGLKWTQADLLQVMEELEPHALSALQTFFLVRSALNAAASALEARLIEWLPGWPLESRAALFLGIPDQPTAGMVDAVLRTAGLRAGESERLAALIQVGHRGPGEIRPDALRWSDAPQLLAYLAEQGQRRWTAAAAALARQRALTDLENALGGNRFRQVASQLATVYTAMTAADRAWDCLTLVMAAAQRWVGAAARETLAASLISQPADVLYLELEELKQVATGEWHAGDREEVLAAVERRMGAAPAALTLAPPEARVVVSPGPCNEPVYCDAPAILLPPRDATWQVETADPGCAPFWAFAGCIQATGLDLWTPGLIAARALGVPARTGV